MYVDIDLYSPVYGDASVIQLYILYMQTEKCEMPSKLRPHCCPRAKGQFFFLLCLSLTGFGTACIASRPVTRGHFDS